MDTSRREGELHFQAHGVADDLFFYGMSRWDEVSSLDRHPVDKVTRMTIVIIHLIAYQFGTGALMEFHGHNSRDRTLNCPVQLTIEQEISRSGSDNVANGLLQPRMDPRGVRREARRRLATPKH